MIVFALVTEKAGASEEHAAGFRGGGQGSYLDRLLMQGILEILSNSIQCLAICKHVAMARHEVGFGVRAGVVDEGVVEELKALLLGARSSLGVLEFCHQCCKLHQILFKTSSRRALEVFEKAPESVDVCFSMSIEVLVHTLVYIDPIARGKGIGAYIVGRLVESV